MSEQDKQPLGVVADKQAYMDLVHRQVRLVKMMNKPVVLTWWLLVINVVLWIAAKTYGIWLGDQGLGTAYLNAEQLSFWTGLKLNDAIADGQWWRLVSSQFVHLDMLHLLFNAYGIFVLGRFLERCYGLRRMLVLYLASGTVGALASFFINPGPAGGASGAVYGLVGGVVVFGIKYRKSLPAELSRALTVGLAPWVILSLAVGFIDAIPIDNAAHVGGLITGALVASVMASRLRQEEVSWSKPVLWALTVVATLVLIWTLAQWSNEAVSCLGSVDDFAACYPQLAAELAAVRDG